MTELAVLEPPGSHNAKVTLEYRNRPIFNADGTVESRKGNSFILQMQLFI